MFYNLFNLQKLNKKELNVWVKLQEVLYNLDHIKSIMPVSYKEEGELMFSWQITFVFTDGSSENIKYTHERDALSDHSWICKKLFCGE